jgi:hypothetical protein
VVRTKSISSKSTTLNSGSKKLVINSKVWKTNEEVEPIQLITLSAILSSIVLFSVLSSLNFILLNFLTKLRLKID